MLMFRTLTGDAAEPRRGLPQSGGKDIRTGKDMFEESYQASGQGFSIVLCGVQLTLNIDINKINLFPVQSGFFPLLAIKEV